MKIQHTPGPWVFAYGSVYRGDTLHDESSIRIAMMDRNEPHTEPCERDSNARLIAAAPDLLEMCISIERIWSQAAGHQIDPESRLAKLRNAIAKATQTKEI